MRNNDGNRNLASKQREKNDSRQDLKQRLRAAAAV
jgi:hypothetical protein